MIPLTVDPTVVLLVNPNTNSGNVVAVATNVARDLKVIVTTSEANFKDLASNKPFDTTRPETLPEITF